MKTGMTTFIMALLSLSLLAGCSRPEQYGEPVVNRNIVPVRDILANPQSYSEINVTVEGEIASECPTGCWFNLRSDNMMLYVDLNPAGFAIPQKVGKKALIEGKIKYEDGQVKLLGKAIEIK